MTMQRIIACRNFWSPIPGRSSCVQVLIKKGSSLAHQNVKQLRNYPKQQPSKEARTWSWRNTLRTVQLPTAIRFLGSNQERAIILFGCLLLKYLWILGAIAHGPVRIRLVRLFWPRRIHSVRDALVASVTSLMITKTQVFGWSAHLNQVAVIGVGCHAILNVHSNVEKQVSWIMDNLCSLMGVTAVLHVERFPG